MPRIKYVVSVIQSEKQLFGTEWGRTDMAQLFLFATQSITTQYVCFLGIFKFSPKVFFIKTHNYLQINRNAEVLSQRVLGMLCSLQHPGGNNKYHQK